MSHDIFRNRRDLGAIPDLSSLLAPSHSRYVPFGSRNANENFESGNLSRWTLSTTGANNFALQSIYTHGGTYAARSGALLDNQMCTMTMNVVGPTKVSWWWMVNSETNYDFLQYLIDGVVQTTKISGTVGWTQVTGVVIPSGAHTLGFRYSKDVSVSVGLDAGMIDDIVFLDS